MAVTAFARLSNGPRCLIPPFASQPVVAAIAHVTHRVLAGGHVGEVARGGLDAGVAEPLRGHLDRDRSAARVVA